MKNSRDEEDGHTRKLLAKISFQHGVVQVPHQPLMHRHVPQLPVLLETTAVPPVLHKLISKNALLLYKILYRQILTPQQGDLNINETPCRTLESKCRC